LGDPEPAIEPFVEVRMLQLLEGLPLILSDAGTAARLAVAVLRQLGAAQPTPAAVGEPIIAVRMTSLTRSARSSSRPTVPRRWWRRRSSGDECGSVCRCRRRRLRAANASSRS
jgi:hypothetical protein